MIVEERRYTFFPGKLQVFLHLYAQEGMKVQRRYLRHLLGYYVSEIGQLNQITALWGYPSLREREEWREALFADPAWIAFVDKVRPLMTNQECRLLKPAPFFKDDLSAFLSAQNSNGGNNNVL
ncbi:NIPSNAP family protein [Pollutimonas sp. H1-120]|uniref:NIPSNAP family protein n=1 Tax=Pollutimonas sp. H1-120 TaxID=3148824 RepID=UPI003B51B81A